MKTYPTSRGVQLPSVEYLKSKRKDIMIRNVNDHDNPLILKPEDYNLDELDKIVGNFSSMQCGYTTLGDCIQFLSEALDIPENIAEYLLQSYRNVENCKRTIRKVNSILVNLNQDIEKEG